MRIWGILNGKKDNLVKDLERTALSFEKLGERYGVSRQAIHFFYRRQRITRSVKPRGHQTERCRLCQKLIQISNEPHSEFISLPTIVNKIGQLGAECRYHLRKLREKGLVDERFGRLGSKKVEKAYTIYFKERLSMRSIGRKVGLKNFPSVVRKHRELGWNVPPSLYVYNRRKGSRVKPEIQKGDGLGADRMAWVSLSTG